MARPVGSKNGVHARTPHPCIQVHKYDAYSSLQQFAGAVSPRNNTDVEAILKLLAEDKLAGSVEPWSGLGMSELQFKRTVTRLKDLGI